MAGGGELHLFSQLWKIWLQMEIPPPKNRKSASRVWKCSKTSSRQPKELRPIGWRQVGIKNLAFHGIYEGTSLKTSGKLPSHNREYLGFPWKQSAAGKKKKLMLGFTELWCFPQRWSTVERRCQQNRERRRATAMSATIIGLVGVSRKTDAV